MLYELGLEHALVMMNLGFLMMGSTGTGNTYPLKLFRNC